MGREDNGGRGLAGLCQSEGHGWHSRPQRQQDDGCGPAGSERDARHGVSWFLTRIGLKGPARLPVLFDKSLHFSADPARLFGVRHTLLPDDDFRGQVSIVPNGLQALEHRRPVKIALQ